VIESRFWEQQRAKERMVILPMVGKDGATAFKLGTGREDRRVFEGQSSGSGEKL